MRLFAPTPLALLSLSVLAASGCAKDPTEGKTAAKVEVAQAVQAAPAVAEAEVLSVTPATSKIGFIGAKVTAQHVGEFKDFQGKVSLKEGKIEGGQLEFEVKIDSVIVDGGLPRLEGHLKSDDFFDMENHPTARFVSTEIRQGSDTEGMSHTVVGNLTLRGTTKSVSFPARIDVTDGAVRAMTEFGINRKDFNIVYAGKADDLIQDNVLLQVELDAKRS